MTVTVERVGGGSLKPFCNEHFAISSGKFFANGGRVKNLLRV